MAKPPPTPPSSDIDSVNRDARAGGTPPSQGDPGGDVQRAKDASSARPDEGAPAGE